MACCIRIEYYIMVAIFVTFVASTVNRRAASAQSEVICGGSVGAEEVRIRVNVASTVDAIDFIPCR